MQDIKENDMVLTRKGFKKVIWSGITGRDKLVSTYKIGDNILKCTPDHKIYTLFGFKQSQLLTGKIILCTLDSKKRCDKQLNSMGISSIDIQNQSGMQTEDIIVDGQVNEKCIYTFLE